VADGLLYAGSGLEPGHDFDPDRFDLDEANCRLRAAPLGAYASQLRFR
jgi:hypothetical protein